MDFTQYFHVCFVLIMCKLITVQSFLPDYIHVCHRSDPDINKCIIQSVEHLRPKLQVGIPELMVPAMEPLHLGDISLQRGSQGARVNLNLTQLQAWGPSTFIIKSVNHHIEKNQFQFKALIPNLHFKGKYSINMNVLFIKFTGRGDINGNFTNFLIEAKMQGDKVYNKTANFHHLVFNKIHLNLKIPHSDMKLEGLFGGDPILEEVANNILEDNSAVFVEEIRPALEESLGEVFKNIANGITGSFTYDELFPL